MASWSEFKAADPELAREVEARFSVRKHATLATLRRDGAPRISGSEVEFGETDLFIGSMPAAVKALDLRRDPRFALHSPTVDPPPDDAAAWAGEAKLAGTVEEIGDVNQTAAPHRFRLDLTEVVLTRVADGQLEVTSWHPDRGRRVIRRD